jgi:hypothetical protein
MRLCRSLSGGRENSRGAATGEQREVCISPELIEVTFEPGVSPEQRARVLVKGDIFCEMCGAAPGDIDDLTKNRATFHIELVPDKGCGGKDELSNLRTLCSTCNQGAKNITTEKPSAIWLLSQVRRAGQEEQRSVMKWLLKKFKE